MATVLAATISDQKSALEKWTPVFIFDVVLKDGVPRFWAKQGLAFGGNNYAAIILDHSEFRQEGNGVYGVDAVTEIGLTLNNADANLNALLAPAVWQGGIIQPRFILVAPDGATTTDAIVYPKFLIDLPSATWPRVEFSAHNRWNLGRKTLPVSLVTRKDRYPFPDTAAERTAAGSDPSSPFFAIGYDPDSGKGNMKPGGGYYRRFDYDGTREKLREIGLEVRYGGFGKVPPTVVGSPSKGERADYTGNANEAKYGQAVPLVFGICRIQPIVLDTGFPSGIGGWNGSRLSHYLLSDGVNFAPEHINGIEDVLDVFIPDSAKFQRIPETSNQPQTTGAWSFQGGYYGSQKAPASSKYRNIDQAIDFPDPVGDFTNRDLYSGLAFLEIGFPKELSGQDGIGPKLEAIVKGLKLEWWDSSGNSDWAWTDNPVWIFVHCLKLLRWTTAEMDKPTIAAAAAYCDEIVPSGKKRFRCNLALMNQTAARDVLRGIRNNCRMYTTFAPDGKLQLRIARDLAGEGGLAFALDNTNIMRGDDGQLLVEKFHRSIYEIANVFSATFQNEENLYNSDSYIKVDVGNVNQIDERISSDSIFPILGLPSFDQAERQMEWARQEQVVLNEYYRVTCSLALIETKVGQVGTITEPRHGLISQQVRIRAMAPGPDAGTVELTLQKHSDGAYTDNAVETPFTRAQADSSYTPRSVGGMSSASPAPRLTEITVADPTNADASVRRIKVEFKPPAQDYEGIFSRETKISDVVVATSGGSIPGGQVLFVEVSPVKDGARGLASEYLMAVVPSGGNSNRISLTCELPPEATHYIAFVGNFPGQTYEALVEPSPGTAPFTISITNLNRNFGSIPPDPQFDHVQIFYTYNSSPNVLRDGGRTSAPDESVIEFEPEAPAAEDTQVTVIVSSSNAAEDDFYPINISPKAILTLTYENGPAQGWTATLLPGPTPSSVIAKFTRPTINGKRLFWVAAQIKDSGTGAWRELDDNAGAAVTYYDGSAIAHESIGGLRIKKDPGQPVGFGTAHLDDLMMLDVAGGSFDRDRCQWGTVEKFLDDLGAETTAANARYIALTGGLFRPQTTQDLRMKIVKPPHTWDTDGYIGPSGVWWEWIGDREGDEFMLAPFEIGREIASVDVRFWIENDYCRSGGNGTHSTNAVKVRAAMDFVIPGPVQSLVVTGANGEFVAKWADPLTGAATIDDVAIQWATDAGFTAIVGTAAGWGDVNRLSGTDPGKTYYWRLAAHNLSDQPSDASTVSLGATGWGPWTNYGAPTAVSSGDVGPQDTVPPGPVQNLVVTGANGNFVADWDDPATGNLTLDNTAIEWATDAGFTNIVDTAVGWGKVNHLSSTLPLATYFFRVAVHNAIGWGPWTAYGAPTAVSSGSIPGAGGPVDTVLPGFLQSLVVSGENGNYVANWLDPATGYQTIDDIALQWATNPGFTIGVGTAAGWGDVNHLQSTSPGTTFYFRLAAHNQSGLTSDSSTFTQLGPTGWGPWTQYGAPTAVSSGGMAGAPIDTVIPGPVQTLNVTGINGEFIATWVDPATGNLTLDDTAEQYATDAAFTIGLVTASGWGHRNRLQGTDPGKTYFFRFAVHNQSNQPSHASTIGTLGATGWGPWTNYGAPTAVSSGDVPLDAAQIPESLVYNGGFELDADNDGKPDGWIVFDIGAAGYGWGISTPKYEGKQSLVIANNLTGKVGIASDAFPVTSEELLTFSAWAALSGGPNSGLYFRLFYHPSNPDFLIGETGVTQEDLFAATDPVSGWTNYQKQFKVPAGMGYCRIALYNYGAGSVNTNYFFDDVQILRRISGGEINDNTIPPNRFTGQARTEFVETFDTPLADFWVKEQGGVVSYPNAGVDGGKVLQVNGGANFYTETFKIPYDPRKLYKITCRARLIQVIDTANAKFYMGFRTFDKNGALIGAVYPAAFALNTYPSWGTAWQELTGWFHDVGASPFQPAPDAATPTPLQTGTTWISPTWSMNWQATAGAGNIMELDDIRIEIFDEQVYQSNAPNGIFGGLDKIVYYPHPDAQSTTNSAVSFMWNYTQGLVKAQQFSIYISDGAAAWVQRVQALPGTTAQRHQFDLYRLLFNRPLTVSITAEAVAYGGQVSGSTTTWGTFTPNAPTGVVTGGTIVGTLDWAGGDVWFESYQYRNNIWPSNGIGGGVTFEYVHSGSGASRAVIHGLNTYVQGTYIATHIAVVIKVPAGTPVLNQDMVVTYISMAALPADFQVPLSIPDNMSCSVTVAALAECRNGRIFNTTFATPLSKALGIIFIQNSNGGPGGASDRRIQLAQPGTGETIQFYAPMQMYSPYSTLKSYSAGGGYQGGFSGDANGMYMANAAGEYFWVTQQTNFGFGTTNFGGPTGSYFIGIKDQTGTVSFAPTGGGVLFSQGGAGWWYTSAGNFRNFAPSGPHCSKCGYDFWTVAGFTPKLGASLYICGWCGEVYKTGPKNALKLLTKNQRKEIITHKNAHKFGTAVMGGMNDKDQGPAKARPCRCRAGRRRQTDQNHLRRARSRKLRHGS